ncbi:MAG: YceI family protein [Desulfarculaceae bacterium]|jgi:polyisoprenoid-binding protein YceI
MKRLAPVVALGLALALTAAPGYAATKWEIDKPHCAIWFEVRHIFAMVPGFFEDFTGTIIFDPQDLAASRVDIKIAIASINTRIEERDAHLRTPDFFDAARFPYMTFKSNEIVHQGGNRYVAKGRLTLKKVTKQIELPFTFLGAKDHPMVGDKMVAGMEAAYVLDRLQYGVGSGKFYNLGVVGKDVAIKIHLELLSPK